LFALDLKCAAKLKARTFQPCRYIGHPIFFFIQTFNLNFWPA